MFYSAESPPTSGIAMLSRYAFQVQIYLFDVYIQVVNAGGSQVGHIPRAVAANLATLMDRNQISVEGRMIGQNLDGAKHFKLPL